MMSIMIMICSYVVSDSALLPFVEKFAPCQLKSKMRNTIVNLPNPVSHEPDISFLRKYMHFDALDELLCVPWFSKHFVRYWIMAAWPPCSCKWFDLCELQLKHRTIKYIETICCIHRCAPQQIWAWKWPNILTHGGPCQYSQPPTLALALFTQTLTHSTFLLSAHSL